MSKCTLCGGSIGSDGRCRECGMRDYRLRESGYTLNRKMPDALKEAAAARTEPDRRSTQSGAGSKRGKPGTARSVSPSQNYDTTEWMSGGQPAPEHHRKSGGAGRAVLKVIGAVLLISALLGGASELLGKVERFHLDDYFQVGQKEENQAYDPYEGIAGPPVGNAVKEEYQLEPGFYTVGVHIAPGTYSASELDADGSIDVTDDENGVYLYEYPGSEDSHLDDLWLFDGASVFIGGSSPVTIRTANAAKDSIHAMNNPLSGEAPFTFTDSIEIGKDCKAGVYDLTVEEGAEGEIDFYYPEVTDENRVFSLYMYELEDGRKDGCRNLILPEGVIITAEDSMKVTLTPVEVIRSTDYMTDNNIGIYN